ncbi:transcriptional regulator [Lentilactobacillus fungorum]|uniref:Transcriptional regulator n=1 Tax=Lentilactobacillus fungorum TaxID=2201250 RepID=A0ABQ3VX93_9LACO|nr:helix-turn-helix transcriptional regulator [Lentilactobacillus fungorum]GHP13013.1 transcriptional regulator [Lentilactobacillus fungorum]
MTVGINVRRLRKARGYSQTDLAIRSGILQTTISSIERGGDPTSTNLSKLADALNVTADDLLKEKEVTK